jgi:hypothetical protein
MFFSSLFSLFFHAPGFLVCLVFLGSRLFVSFDLDLVDDTLAFFSPFTLLSKDTNKFTMSYWDALTNAIKEKIMHDNEQEYVQALQLGAVSLAAWKEEKATSFLTSSFPVVPGFGTTNGTLWTGASLGGVGTTGHSAETVVHDNTNNPPRLQDLIAGQRNTEERANTVFLRPAHGGYQVPFDVETTLQGCKNKAQLESVCQVTAKAYQDQVNVSNTLASAVNSDRLLTLKMSSDLGRIRSERDTLKVELGKVKKERQSPSRNAPNSSRGSFSWPHQATSTPSAPTQRWKRPW